MAEALERALASRPMMKMSVARQGIIIDLRYSMQPSRMVLVPGGRYAPDEVEGCIREGEGGMDTVCNEWGWHWVCSWLMACQALF